MESIRKKLICYGCFLLFIIFLSFYELPYLTLVLFLGFIVIFNECTEDKLVKEYNLWVFFLFSFVLMCIPYASKTLTPVMNDKGFYYGYMLDVYNQGLIQWLHGFNGNDILSYFLLMVSSHVFGVNNQAFAFFYFISYVAMFVGARKMLGYYVLIFIFLFIPQYNYQGLYGNVIRQGLGLSLFIVAISNNNRWKYFYGFLAALAHFSFFICIPFYFVVNKIKYIKTKYMILLMALSYLIGGVVLKYLMVYAGGISSYVSTRINAYQDGDFGNSIVRKVVMTFIFIFIVEFLFLSIKKKERITEVMFIVRSYFIMMCSVFFLTISFQEIANRYAFNLMVFVFIYISFYISIMKSKKIYFMYFIVGITFPIYIYINIVGVQYFYFGNLSSILTDNLREMMNKVL